MMRLVIMLVLAFIFKSFVYSQASEKYYLDSLNSFPNEILKQHPDSLLNIGKGIEKIARQNNWLKLEAKALKTIASSYYYKEDFKKSARYFQKEAKKLEELKNNKDLTNTYYNLGTLYLQIEKYNQSAKWYEKCLDLTQQLKKEELAFDIYQRLYMVYDKQNKHKKALNYYKLYYSIKESKKEAETKEQLLTLREEKNRAKKIIRIKEKVIKNKSEELKEINTVRDSLKKDVEKKGQKIVKLKVENTEKELEIIEEKEKVRAQKRIITQIAIGLIVTILYIFLLILLYFQKKRANKNLAYKNNEIEAQKNEIEAQRDEIEQQHKFIITQNKNILDSINYARQIQNALIPDFDFKNTIIKDYFVLFKPKDVVSGDFYWFAEINNKLVIVAADCTGHGVPGAFMSMLGMTFLDEVVNKKGVTAPHQILNETRDKIIDSLKQKKGHSKDGMDISIVTIDTERSVIQFAGANNPLYIITDNIMKEIKADKMPVSFYYKMESFTCHEFPIEKDMSVYLFSDGYADQFGGKDCKKYKYRNFKNLLLENSDKTCNIQYDILDDEFIDWMGPHDQIDDVLILGLKF